MSAKKSIRIQVEDEDNKKSVSTNKKTLKTGKAVKEIKSQEIKKSPTKTKVVKKTTKKRLVKKQSTIIDKKSEVERAIQKAEDEANETLDLSINKIEKTDLNKKDKLFDNENVNKIKVTDEDSLSLQEETPAEATPSKLSPVEQVVKENETILPPEQDPEIREVLKHKLKAKRSIKLYRNIAYFFIILVAGLLLSVFYFLFVKTTIIIVPNQENVRNSMLMDIYDSENAASENQNGIPGLVRKETIEIEDDFTPTGSTVIGKEAVGKVTIYNHYTKSQPLVATTRLLTPDNKLFRLAKTVNVPAGGAVEAEIYADEPKEDMSVGPTRFTIPGLWAGLQDKIYAESTEKIEYKQKVKKFVKSDDIENALRELKQKLLIKAKSEINNQYNKYSKIIYKIDENSINTTVGADVGDEVNSFNVAMTADVVVVAFDNKNGVALAKQKFISSLDNNKELIKFNEDNIVYALNNYDIAQAIATVNASFEGKISLKDGTAAIDKNKILGLKETELKAYLATLPDIAGYEIKFTPSFWRHVPKLADRVEIQIKK